MGCREKSNCILMNKVLFMEGYDENDFLLRLCYYGIIKVMLFINIVCVIFVDMVFFEKYFYRYRY